jgi:hypothetical protein
MNEPKPDLATHERLLNGVRQEVRNLQVMQMRPGQSAEKLAHLADLEGSARAEVKLRIKALAYARGQVDQPASPKPADGSPQPPQPVPKTPQKRGLRNSVKTRF